MKDFSQKIPLSVKFFLLFVFIILIVSIIMIAFGFVTLSEMLIKLPLFLVLFLVLFISAWF